MRLQKAARAMPRSQPSTPLRAATLADVGKAAGVSAVAASLVLNGAENSSRIAAATRKRILKAAAALRYRPNAAARALVNRRMHTLGVTGVLEGGELSNYFLQVFNGILEAAGRHQQNATVFSLPNWDSFPARLPAMCDGRIDGLIIIAPRVRFDASKVLAGHTPIVALQANTRLPNILNIRADDEQGAYEMVRHLIARGHRRIMHVSGAPDLVEPKRRIDGYRRALAEAHISFEPRLLVHAAFTTISGRDSLRAWLRRHAGEPLPQAIFCVNDSVAIGCLQALSEAGLRVPADVSLAGIDDSLFGLTTMPKLTTVRQPLRAMGQRAVEELLQRIDHEKKRPGGKPPSVEPIVYPIELVLRESVAAPPTAVRLAPQVR
jgi:LacI family transcriptional regulator